MLRQVVVLLLACLVRCCHGFVTMMDLSERLQDKSLNATMVFQNLETSKALAKQFCNMAQLNEMPFMHRLMVLYSHSRDVSQRRDLVKVMTKCVTMGANVQSGFANDPSVLFKALYLREMNLAKLIAQHQVTDTTSSSSSSSSEWLTKQLLNHLYSLPCEPVPLAKLLLHANTIVASKPTRVQAFGGVEGVKKLISSASLGVDTKPAVKGEDLASLSRIYGDIVGRMGNKDLHVALYDVIRSLDEVSASTHTHILAHTKGLAHVVSIMQEQDATSKRNSFHSLGVSGAVEMIGQVATAARKHIASLEDAKSTTAIAAFKRILCDALQAEDFRGHTPLSYANARFGNESSPYTALLELYEVAGASTVLFTLDEVKGTFSPDTQSLSVNNDGGTATTQSLRVGNGGWNTERLDESIDVASDARCDIRQVWSDVPPTREEFTMFLIHATPVIFRGAAQGNVRLLEAFAKEAFLAKYGDERIPVGDIPYPSTFGRQGKIFTLKQMAEIVSLDNNNNNNNINNNNDATAKTSPQASASYAFAMPHSSWQDKIRDDAPTPAFLPLEKDNSEIQFYLGPAGSGAPAHFHGHAVNTLAYGAKHWYLYPPSKAFYSTTPAYQFSTENGRGGERGGKEEEALECTQMAGDIMFVPTLWGHATINVMQSIGVAHEFSVEAFCME